MFFEKCKSVKDGFKSHTYPMIDNEGNLVSDPKITMNNFQLYFENLLNIQTHHEIDNANGIWEQDEGQMYATVEPEVPERRTYFGRIKAIVESLRTIKHQERTI